MNGLRNFLIFSFILLGLASCAGKKSLLDNAGYYKVGSPYKVDNEWYYPKEQPEYDEVGISSWYGSDFHGKKTANGAVYDKNALTAAHNTLPLPSMVRVTNLDNNKTLILMVNDRGPFSKKRIIDVSEKAAEILGYKDKGTAKVRVQFLKGQTKRLLADLDDSKKGGKSFALFGKDEPKTAAADNNENDFVATSAIPASNKVSASEIAPLTAAKEKPEETIKLASLNNSEASVEPDVKLGDPTPDMGNNKKSKNDKIVPKKVKAPKKTTAPKKPKQQSKNTEKPAGMIETEEGMAQVIDEPKEATAPAAKAKEPSVEVASPKAEETAKTEAKAEEVVLPSAVDAPAATASAPADKAGFSYIQAGTYSVKENAERVSKAMRALGDVAIKPVTVGDKTLYRVRLGPIDDPEIAKMALEKVIKLGHADARLVGG